MKTSHLTRHIGAMTWFIQILMVRQGTSNLSNDRIKHYRAGFYNSLALAAGVYCCHTKTVKERICYYYINTEHNDYHYNHILDMYVSSTTFNFCLTNRFFQAVTENVAPAKMQGWKTWHQIAGMQNAGWKTPAFSTAAISCCVSTPAFYAPPFQMYCRFTWVP